MKNILVATDASPASNRAVSLAADLAAKYDGQVKVTKLNVDENPSTAMTYQVRSIPTLLFFKGGERVDQVIGAASKSELKKRFDAVT